MQNVLEDQHFPWINKNIFPEKGLRIVSKNFLIKKFHDIIFVRIEIGGFLEISLSRNFGF